MEFHKLNDLERSSILVQYISTEAIEFYPTADGTDLVQDILRRQLPRNEDNIYGADGSASVENDEFFNFYPVDSKQRSIHLPVEHLAYCGALRRMKRDDGGDRENSRDNLVQREFENVDLANRYPYLITGPPIFVAIFHGFDNALCYTFLTQSADDARLLVMKLMRAFHSFENRLQQRMFASQGQQQTGLDHHLHPSSRNVSPFQDRSFAGDPRQQNQQRQFFSSSPINTGGANNFQSIPHYGGQQYNTDNDALIQRLLQNPNVQVINSPFTSNRIDDIPVLSPPTTSMSPTPGLIDQLTGLNINPGTGGTRTGSDTHLVDSSSVTPGVSYPIQKNEFPPDVSLSGTPQVIYRPNNQEVVYKQNIMVRWLQPPTPPPPAPIIIREVQSAPEQQPPIICRQVPQSPPTPPPIVVRERPPMCPPMCQPLIIEKRLPPVNMPRQVIIERFPPPPPKPPAIIYEKYLPQQPQRRPVIVQRERCVEHPARRRVIRSVPQHQMANICIPQTTMTTAVQQQQQNVSYVHPQSQVLQQFVPVYAAQQIKNEGVYAPEFSFISLRQVKQLNDDFTLIYQRVIQPKGVRVIRQVIGPTQQQQSQFINAPQVIQGFPAATSNYMQAGAENTISYVQPSINQIAATQQYVGQPQFTYVTS
ncbi:unnamed protein product [Didymodactylos carnosus]|uniref:Uncharacterized protein n=1 Tax=Didymodactylos carnosus TaxID=1234261 RepID=A0A814HQK3_9BILA|nr:unnamed protein product [Didymodactylos carnosus]CAF1114299.1 unnamed protein product [Didymodactylos carnosus]CAF3784754.1 unnamed protein product [Didymodactylos carnosus]CAF3883471.1 unnamed protein product [Didymodactylos carnosus]